MFIKATSGFSFTISIIILSMIQYLINNVKKTTIQQTPIKFHNNIEEHT